MAYKKPKKKTPTDKQKQKATTYELLQSQIQALETRVKVLEDFVDDIVAEDSAEVPQTPVEETTQKEPEVIPEEKVLPEAVEVPAPAIGPTSVE